MHCPRNWSLLLLAVEPSRDFDHPIDAIHVAFLDQIVNFEKRPMKGEITVNLERLHYIRPIRVVVAAIRGQGRSNLCGCDWLWMRSVGVAISH